MNSLLHDNSVSTTYKSNTRIGTIRHRKNKSSISNSTSLSSFDTSELDTELMDLHQKYMHCKETRKKSEMDYNLLRNRVNLLLNEETKIKTKEKKTMSNMERASKLREEKEKEKKLLLQSKAKIEQKINELRNTSKTIKKDRCLSSICRISKDQRDLLIKIKNERKKDYEKYLDNKQNELNKKKEMVKEIQKQRNLSIENKRKGEFNKKIQMKKELLQKIIDEENKAKEYEKGVIDFHKETIEIMNRIKLLTEASSNN